ncbi:hypothetical protein MNBD_GAMMA26-800 [hydrothermal vent metagenome]|uniref:Glycosyltransferase n=1 Tax=hydrothermal vent metagenome TaxID=652676 RepID=A0A3B1B9D5_9ZZZZ
MHIWFPTVRANSGADQYVKYLADGLTKLGHTAEVTWFSHFYEVFPAMMDRKYVPNNVDVIHTNSWCSYPKCNIPIVTTVHHCVHDPIFNPYRSKLQKIYHELIVKPHEAKAFNQAVKTIAVSHYTAKTVSEIFPDVQPEVIINGVDAGFFSPLPDHHHTQSTTFRLLFVGTQSRRKGIDLLPIIMQKLGSRYSLYIAGDNANKKIKAASNIHTLGHLTKEQLRHWYRQCDALLFPTRYEGFGFAVCEAMACGKPAITTNVTALPEVVQDKKNGLLCPLDDIEAFVEAVRYLKDNPEHKVQLGISARKSVEAHFTLDRMINEYANLYKSLCSVPARQY